jgi:hypothetical protein
MVSGVYHLAMSQSWARAKRWQCRALLARAWMASNLSMPLVGRYPVERLTLLFPR